MINKIKSLWTNRVFRYSLSWSLILSGIIFSFTSMYFSYSGIKELIPDFIIVIGAFLNPDFDVNKTTKIIYHLIILSSIAIVIKTWYNKIG